MAMVDFLALSRIEFDRRSFLPVDLLLNTGFGAKRGGNNKPARLAGFFTQITIKCYDIKQAVFIP